MNLGLCAWLHVQARKHMPVPACVLRLSCTILLDAKNAWERIGREQGERRSGTNDSGMCGCTAMSHGRARGCAFAK